MNDLKVGTIFSYYGPRSLPFFKRGLALGVIVGLQEEKGIVLVRTFETRGDDESIVSIGFIPVTYKSFKKSLHRVYDDRVIEVKDAWREIQIWREDYLAGRAGVFIDQIWKAEDMAWSVVKNKDPSVYSDKFGLLYAYPVVDEDGAFTIVRAESFLRTVD